MEIAIDLPNDFMALQEKQKVKNEMRLGYTRHLKLHFLKLQSWQGLIFTNL